MHQSSIINQPIIRLKTSNMSKYKMNGHASDVGILSKKDASLTRSVSTILATQIMYGDRKNLLRQNETMLAFSQANPQFQKYFMGNFPSDTDELDRLSNHELEELAFTLQKVFKTISTDLEVVEILAAKTDDNLVSELNNVDFEKLMGGPLQAAIKAQVASSNSTIEYIQEVGFNKNEDGEIESVKYVEFMYDEKTGEVDDDGNEVTKSKLLKVPLLSMVTLPAIRIENLEVDFNVKLNSVQSRKTSSKLGVNAEVKAGWGPVKFKVSAAYQRASSMGVKVSKEYTMNVKLKATQDEIPAGVEKVLNLLAA